MVQEVSSSFRSLIRCRGLRSLERRLFLLSLAKDEKPNGFGNDRKFGDLGLLHPLCQSIHIFWWWPEWGTDELGRSGKVLFCRWRCRTTHCIESTRMWVRGDDTVQQQRFIRRGSLLLPYLLKLRCFVLQEGPFIGHTAPATTSACTRFYGWCNDLVGWWFASVGDRRGRASVRFSERGTVEGGDRDAMSITQMFEHLYCIWWVDIAYWQIKLRREQPGWRNVL